MSDEITQGMLNEAMITGLIAMGKYTETAARAHEAGPEMVLLAMNRAFRDGFAEALKIIAHTATEELDRRHRHNIH